MPNESLARVTSRQAAARLAERDPVIAGLVREFGLPRMRVSKSTPLAELVRGITYQQIGGAAAGAIHRRLLAAIGDDFTPQRLLELDDATLRTVGLSGGKVASIRDLAAKVADGTVIVSPRRLARRTDDEIIAELTRVRGIGPWSAQMFLILQMRRPDVWPTGDLAVRKGFGLGWGIPTPTPKELELLAEPYRPYRTTVAWYCWQVAERRIGASAPIPLP
jgi:DNA-3-methyladenine glycosylase II